MTHKVKRFLVTLAAVTMGFGVVLFIGAEIKGAQTVEVQEPIPHRDVMVQEPIPHKDEVFATLRTYTPPVNIYLPTMMFLVAKDIDSKGIMRCKNMAYRTVDSFSRRVNSNLVRADKKLDALARIVYNECIDVTIDAYKEGL